MLGLYGAREVNYIFSNEADDLEKITTRALETYKTRPGFFTPYKKVSHAVGEAIAPVVYPIAGGVVAVFSLLAAAVSTVCCVGAFLVAVGASVFDNPKLCNEAFDFAGLALHFVGTALISAVMAATLGGLSVPHSVFSLITRSGATAAHWMTGYDDNHVYSAEEEENKDSTLVF